MEVNIKQVYKWIDEGYDIYLCKKCNQLYFGDSPNVEKMACMECKEINILYKVREMGV